MLSRFTKTSFLRKPNNHNESKAKSVTSSKGSKIPIRLFQPSRTSTPKQSAHQNAENLVTDRNSFQVIELKAAEETTDVKYETCIESIEKTILNAEECSDAADKFYSFTNSPEKHPKKVKYMKKKETLEQMLEGYSKFKVENKDKQLHCADLDSWNELLSKVRYANQLSTGHR